MVLNAIVIVIKNNKMQTFHSKVDINAHSGWPIQNLNVSYLSTVLKVNIYCSKLLGSAVACIHGLILQDEIPYQRSKRMRKWEGVTVSFTE
jgi:hypothetical protein